MRKTTKTLSIAASVLLALGYVACSDDAEDDTVAAEDAGGTGNTDGDDGDSDASDTGGTDSQGDGGEGAVDEGETGGAEPAGGAGGAGGAPSACDLSREGREEEVIEAGTNWSGELDAAKVYVLEGNVYVDAGDTLTIPPCTRIEGDGPTKATLIVTRGGRIEAEGTADAPILFTARDEAEAGSWGGLLLLGQAPCSLGEDVAVEGLPEDPRHQFGGTDPDDDSGILRYVRLEYTGIDLGNGNEINGLSLAGVGSGTTISHVMVKETLDDCFEFFGGTVSADHLVCVDGGDDMFDADDGYVGTLSYVFGQHGAQSSSDPSGLEWDGTDDKAGEWDTVVTLQNATLCSNEASLAAMVLRRGITGQIDELVAVGFPIGVDLRDAVSGISITNSVIVADALAQDEPAGTADVDDDGGVDDAAWFLDGTGNSEDDPGFSADDCMAANPDAAVFESDLGAFEGDADWARGLWTGWE